MTPADPCNSCTPATAAKPPTGIVRLQATFYDQEGRRCDQTLDLTVDQWVQSVAVMQQEVLGFVAFMVGRAAEARDLTDAQYKEAVRLWNLGAPVSEIAMALDVPVTHLRRLTGAVTHRMRDMMRAGQEVPSPLLLEVPA